MDSTPICAFSCCTRGAATCMPGAKLETPPTIIIMSAQAVHEGHRSQSDGGVGSLEEMEVQSFRCLRPARGWRRRPAGD